MIHFLPFISSHFDCSYLAVSDLTERSYLSGEGVHVHPMHPPAYAPGVSDEEPVSRHYSCSVALESSLDQKLSSHFLIEKTSILIYRTSILIYKNGF